MPFENSKSFLFSAMGPNRPWMEKRFRRINLPEINKNQKVKDSSKNEIRAERAGGLKGKLELAEGCRVMLR